MNSELNVSGEQLEDAFALFNQMSEKLADSYGDLETQVAQLTSQLASAHNERLKQLAEKELLAKRLEELLDTLPAGVVVLDANGHITQANPIAEDMLGEKLPGYVWEALARQVFISDGDELRLHDGRWVNVTARPLHAEPGKIILITDITETYSLQNMLSRQQRLTSLGEMIASLAHQVRTPLASALLYLSNISHPNAKQEDRLRFTTKARERLHHLDRMVNDMLLFARGGVTASECFDVQAFVNQFKQMLEPQVDKFHVALQVENQIGNVSLCGNRDALLGVLQNLACNAIEACDESPVLQITVSHVAGEMVEFSIRDNGRGIPEAIRERILEPFFTTRCNGTGLGLAVVNATVNSHNGVLDIESEEGVGSCFRIMLPLAKQREMLSSELTMQDIKVSQLYINRHFSEQTENIHMYKEVSV